MIFMLYLITSFSVIPVHGVCTLMSTVRGCCEDFAPDVNDDVSRWGVCNHL